MNDAENKTFVFPHLQWRHLIPALNAWAARALYTTARPIVTQFFGHGCINDLKTECSFDSQATSVIDVLGLLFTYCQWVF